MTKNTFFPFLFLILPLCINTLSFNKLRFLLRQNTTLDAMLCIAWLLLFLLEIFTHVCGWGPVGHSIIIRLAQSQLNGSAPEWIHSLIPWHWNGNLSTMGSWADDILYPDANPTGYGNWQWSRELHFINTLDWSCDYKPERDCTNDRCLAGAIRNYTKRLETQCDEIQGKEALYFLIHYVGDIHQPLHTAFTSDRGGNYVRGRFMNQTFQTNLHSLWDGGIITIRLRRDFQSNISLYYDHIFDLMNNQSPIDNDDDINQWVKENIQFVCSQIYLDESNMTMNSSVNFTLGEIYYNRSIPVIEQRLAQGGRRLGVLLNQIAKNRPQKPSDKKEKLSPSTIALIAVLSGEFVLAIVIGLILFIRFKKKSSKTYSFPLSPKNT